MPKLIVDGPITKEDLGKIMQNIREVVKDYPKEKFILVLLQDETMGKQELKEFYETYFPDIKAEMYKIENEKSRVKAS